MNRPRSKVTTTLLFVYALGAMFLLVPVQGKNQAQTDQKALQDRAQADLTLIGRLAESPQLMNIDYLECYLGSKDSSLNAPSTEPHRASAPAIVTLWHDPYYNVPYRLETSRQSQNDYAAEFREVIPDNTRQRLKDLDKILNLSSQPSFDEQGTPVEMYETRPDTKVLVYQTPGLVDINRIRVCYAGNALPLPSAADMQEATQYRRDQALAYQKLGNHEQAAQLLKAHLHSNPEDAEAHLSLAESYKAQCHVNEAISEYRIALDKSGDDDQLRQQCIKGLHSLQVDVPESHAVPASRGINPNFNSANAPMQNPIQSHERININQTPSVPIINNPPIDPTVGF